MEKTLEKAELLKQKLTKMFGKLFLLQFKHCRHLSNYLLKLHGDSSGQLHCEKESKQKVPISNFFQLSGTVH